MYLCTGVSRTTQHCSYNENNGELSDALHRCIGTKVCQRLHSTVVTTKTTKSYAKQGCTQVYQRLYSTVVTRKNNGELSDAVHTCICTQVYQGLHSTVVTTKNNGEVSDAVHMCIKDYTAL